MKIILLFISHENFSIKKCSTLHLHRIENVQSRVVELRCFVKLKSKHRSTTVEVVEEKVFSLI